MKLKILFIMLVAFSLSSIIFVLINNLYLQIYDSSWRGLLSLEFNSDKPKKIFIIGSSSVYSINSTYVHDYLAKNDLTYEVYDLADMSDSPSRRLLSIQNLISLKPDLVVYGIGLFDFEKKLDDVRSQVLTKSLSTYILNPHIFFSEALTYIVNIDLNSKIPTSPKDKTLLTAKYVLRGPEYVDHPFINFKNTAIANIDSFPNLLDSSQTTRLDLSNSNKEFIAFNKIINELQKNNIDVLIFTNPYHRSVLNHFNDNDKLEFVNKLKKIAMEKNLHVYFFHDKYADINIWKDPVHVAVNKTASIYSEDIAKIILKEFNHVI